MLPDCLHRDRCRQLRGVAVQPARDRRKRDGARSELARHLERAPVAGREQLRLAGGAALVATVGGRGTLWIAGGVSALAAIAGLFALSASRDQAEAATNTS